MRTRPATNRTADSFKEIDERVETVLQGVHRLLDECP
jgi:hypothetical protein